MGEILRFKLARTLPGVAGGSVCEVSPLTEPTRRVMLWSGEAPDLSLPAHPALSRPSGQGRLDGVAVWYEDRPPGCLLSDLPRVLPQRDAAQIVAGLAEALAALHTAGLAYGELASHAIAVRRDGRPVLLGVGVSMGTPSEDVASLMKLYRALVGKPPAVRTDSAAELVAALHEWLDGVGRTPNTLADLVSHAQVHLSPKARLIELEVGGDHDAVDEVAVDVGPDEFTGGLLDTWSRTGDRTNEVTGERTGMLPAADDAEQRRRSVLAQLAAGPMRAANPQRFHAAEGTASRAVKEVIFQEPLDPLPSPDGLAGSVSRARPEIVERTSEITANRRNSASDPAAGLLARATSSELADEARPSIADFLPERLTSWQPPDINVWILALAILLAAGAGAAAVLLLTWAF